MSPESAAASAQAWESSYNCHRNRLAGAVPRQKLQKSKSLCDLVASLGLRSHDLLATALSCCLPASSGSIAFPAREPQTPPNLLGVVMDVSTGGKFCGRTNHTTRPLPDRPVSSS